MKFTFQVDYNDGTTVEAVAETEDIIDFEEQWSRSILTALTDRRVTDLYWLAWKSLQRKGDTALEWRPWQGTVDNVKMTDEEADPRPLARKARRTSTS